MVACDACQNWHREGKHTADAVTRRANLAKLKAQGGRYLPNGIEAMTFGEATQIRDQLDADVSRLSDELNSFPKGPMGLTPDSVRATSEWRAANAAYGRAFAALRNFNEQYVKLFRSELAAARRARRGGYAPNAAEGRARVYYVWVLSPSGEPLSSEGPYGPHDLEGAKTFARISATEGNHDRAVSRGLDPQSPSFEVVRRYRRRTGERVL